MAGNTFGTLFRVTTYGESHGVSLGCVIDGAPAGLFLSESDIQKELDRRRPGQSSVTTPRDEKDKVEILSGVFEGKTTGAPILLATFNRDQRSKDYGNIKDTFRPGHADYTWFSKFGFRDYRGGGRSSGRETWARVAAGAVAQKILDKKKIEVVAYAEEIAGIVGETVDLRYIEKNIVRSACKKRAKDMEAAVIAARDSGDSVGGIVRMLIRGIPAGVGEPVFDKADALLAHALLSVGTTKGIEFGSGFASARMRGSEHNDVFTGLGKKKTNYAGGILGGITDGTEISLRVAVKPASSISKKQATVDTKGKKTNIEIVGRHDPCIVPRAIPVMEAMARITLADLLLLARSNRI